jgi:hypothetical protein
VHCSDIEPPISDCQNVEKDWKCRFDFILTASPRVGTVGDIHAELG